MSDPVAARFGALEAVSDISLSPDGSQIAFIAPEADGGNSLYVVSTAEGSAAPHRVTRASGAPELLGDCGWANLLRIVCQVYGREVVGGQIFGFSSIFAADAAGGNLRLLSRRQTARDTAIRTGGGSVIDWLPDDDGHVLMTRTYAREGFSDTLIRSDEEGVGVDSVDVATGTARRALQPRRDAIDYITDGRGNVRILVSATRTSAGYFTGVTRTFYRPASGGDWVLLSRSIGDDGEFRPAAVDAASNRVVGFQQIDGRDAVVSVTLDGSGAVQTLFSHPTVDIDTILLASSSRQVVGASFVTDRRQAMITDGRLRTMTSALSRALGGQQIIIIDEAADGSAYLLLATSDTAPGRYYLYRPASRQLRPLLDVRPQLADSPLATQQAITYTASDGTQIPAYLTLPAGHSDVRGLPTIVMPHGGPSARDEWGFDWLSQYFAARGFAVVQPNFRGSSGYGQQWYQNNGFRSWRAAIGDVTDAGRWLIGQGADPAKLSIVGWSYGGYAALQSGVVAPDLFRSIVAIAPVTDLPLLKQEAMRYTTGRLTRDFVGDGPHVVDGSPSRNARSITAPVLMFHGTEDQNVDIGQSRAMLGSLRSAGRQVDLVEYPRLAHGLERSEARTDMLTRIAAFLPH